MEDLHGDLFLVVVLGLEVGVIGGDVFLDVDSRDGDLLVLPSAVYAHDYPISNGQGDSKDSDEEDVCFEPAMRNNRQDALQHPGYTEDNGSQMEVVEFAITLCDADEGGIFYGRGLGYLHRRVDHGCRSWSLRWR